MPENTQQYFMCPDKNKLDLPDRINENLPSQASMGISEHSLLSLMKSFVPKLLASPGPVLNSNPYILKHDKIQEFWPGIAKVGLIASNRGSIEHQPKGFSSERKLTLQVRAIQPIQPIKNFAVAAVDIIIVIVIVIHEHVSPFHLLRQIPWMARDGTGHKSTFKPISLPPPNVLFFFFFDAIRHSGIFGIGDLVVLPGILDAYYRGQTKVANWMSQQ